MNTNTISIGLFIDGGYYAKIDKSLLQTLSLRIDITQLMQFIRLKVAEDSGIDKKRCHITESHFFRGRYRASDANAKNLLYSERYFEDTLIANDVIFHYKHLREIDGNVIEKGIDVWYALEAYELAAIRKFDYVVLITGDADHEMLIKKLKAMKINVILLTGNFDSSTGISRLLKEEATLHIDIAEQMAENQELVKQLCAHVNK
ncbi:MAG: NYN domain-containing protein [Bacteroidaceae bacterium]|nr:NYN domain-containing protein [Bacteroidaceae bacterium]